MSCVLFLDFDGVTHPANCLSPKLFSCLPLIEAVLRQQEHVHMVISSSWREHKGLDSLRLFFAPDMRARVVGVTPMIKSFGHRWLADQLPPYERLWECAEWMRGHETWDTPWIAIDDQPALFAPRCPHLLVTDPSAGFKPSQVAQLNDMINARL